MPTLEQPAIMKLMHQPPAVPTTPRAMSFWTLLTCAALSGGLLWAGFFPLNQGWCAWFALVPLLALVRARSGPAAIHVAALAGGLIFFLLALKWMRVAHPMMVAAWIALAFYCAIYFPLTVWLLRRVDRLGLPLALTAPVVWVALEYLRAHFLTGFPWFLLGYTQHNYLPLIQVADLGGVYAVSFLVVAVNGLLFDLLSRSGRRPVLSGASVLMLVAACLGYGFWRLAQDDFTSGPRVAILQTNIPQQIKNERTPDGQRAPPAAEQMMQHASALTRELLRRREELDLIVWPETSFIRDWVIAAEGTPEDDLPQWLPRYVESARGDIEFIAGQSRSHLLLGLNAELWGRGMHHERFNSALLVGRDGRELGRYDKIHRVLFGEYVPLRETLPFMNVFSPYGDYDYSLTAGERQTRFTLPTPKGEFRFGVLICYEDSDAVLARRYARATEDGPPVDFLVNISNDGWFDGTEEHELHMAVCRLRAVEARRAVVRSVNMGISGVIDGNGRVTALPGPTWAESKKVAAAFAADVPLDGRASPYALLGDWLAVACAAGCVGLTAASLQRRTTTGMAKPALRP